MTDSNRVQIYLTKTCPFCMGAVQLLNDRNVAFDPVYLDDHPNRREATSAILAGHTTVPLVLIDGKPIGGFDALRALDSSGGLDGLSS